MSIVNKVNCERYDCHWNLGYQYDDNCCSHSIEINRIGECCTYINKTEAEKRIKETIENEKMP